MKVSVIGIRGFPEVEGGVEKHCEALCPLIGKDIQLTVYRRKPYVVSDGDYSNISFVDLPSTTIKGFETVLHSFLSSVHAVIRKPDLVHYHNIGPALFSPIVKLRHIPVVLTYHSANYEHAKWGRFAKALLRFSEKVALGTADRIIFVNKFQMQKYPEEIQRKSVYIPNGVREIEHADNTEYLDEIHLEKKKYILSVGRITPEKGFDTLIKAYKKADKKDYKLVITGGVEFEKDYMNLLKELSEGEEVIFTGKQQGSHLAQLYENAGLFILPSNNEGFPLVMLEAMSYHLDMIVSDIPATRLVSLNEEDYFEKGSVEILAGKITERLKDIKRRNYDLSGYNWQRIADTVSDIYRSMIR